MAQIDNLKRWARNVNRDVVALWIAARSPKTPPLPKVVAALVAGYALSPIDLIPDFIPILGYVDDLILVPLGIAWVVWLIPHSLMTEFRAEASLRINRPTSRVAAIVVIAIWLFMAVVCWVLLF